MRSKLDNRGKYACLLDMQMIILEIYTGPEYKIQEDYHEQRCKVAEHNMETIQKET